MQDMSKIRDLFVYTDGRRNWQVDWCDADGKLHFIQELRPLLNITVYKDVCKAVEEEFGYTMPPKKELADLVTAIISKQSKKRRDRLGYATVYLIAEFQKV